MSLSVSVLRPRVVSTIPISTLRRVDEKKKTLLEKKEKKKTLKTSWILLPEMGTDLTKEWLCMMLQTAASVQSVK